MYRAQNQGDVLIPFFWGTAHTPSRDGATADLTCPGGQLSSEQAYEPTYHPGIRGLLKQASQLGAAAAPSEARSFALCPERKRP